MVITVCDAGRVLLVHAHNRQGLDERWTALVEDLELRQPIV
jgi:hypothetical protein